MSSHLHTSTIVENFDNIFDDNFDETFEKGFEDCVDDYIQSQAAKKAKKKRVHIERGREEGHIRLWNDYFSDQPIYPDGKFRRRFRMNKPLFIQIVQRLSNEVPYFQHRQDAIRRFGLSALQKCTAAIRMMAYGLAADAMNEYLRLGETTASKCLKIFVDGIIHLFKDVYLRRHTPEDLQRLLYIGEYRGFPGMIGSIDCTFNDINVLHRSPVFDDILEGQAPKVSYFVNGRQYCIAYYLTDGIYPKWATFIQSISHPQGPKASLFANCQEAVRKDVKRAFEVLQARFAIVRNPTLSWDKAKIGKIMRARIILHNMIVEDKRDQDTQYDLSEFTQGEGSGTSQVDYTCSTHTPTNMNNMMAN